MPALPGHRSVTGPRPGRPRSIRTLSNPGNAGTAADLQTVCAAVYRPRNIELENTKSIRQEMERRSAKNSASRGPSDPAPSATPTVPSGSAMNKEAADKAV